VPATPTSSAGTATKRDIIRKNVSPVKDNTRMVDANGKQYKSNRVNNMADKSANSARQAEAIYDYTHIGSVANPSPYHHLNW
jgi:hypothetical protein